MEKLKEIKPQKEEEKEEIARWIKAIEKPPNEKKPEKVGEEHPISKFQALFQKGEYQKAREATRQEEWNVMWRIEALCQIVKAQAI